MIRTHIQRIMTDLCEAIRSLESRLGEGFILDNPPLRFIGALAEGFDRLAAAEAIASGMSHIAVLPFATEEYEQDFPASVDEFRTLLGRSAAVITLDGRAEPARIEGSYARNLAYEAAGRLVVDRCDLLLTLWDGAPARGQGGTGQICAEAEKSGIPVLRIHPTAPDAPPELLTTRGGYEPATQHTLGELVERVLLPPQQFTKKGHGQRGTSCHDYLTETRQPSGARLAQSIWKAWMSVIAPLRAHAGAPAADTEQVCGALTDQIIPQAHWADALAISYAHLYRASFLMSFLIGSAAVLCALFSIALPWQAAHGALFLIELVLIGSILLIVWNEKRRKYHAKSLDYRLLAELIRHFRYLSLIGWTPAVPRAPLPRQLDDVREHWMPWYLIAVERSVQPATLDMDASYIAACTEVMRAEWLANERMYHAHNAHRMHLASSTLHRSAEFLFYAALAACLGHLTAVGLDLAAMRWHLETLERIAHALHAVGPALTVVAAGAPLLAATCHGIASQAEFDRLGERSSSVVSGLDRDIASLGAGSAPDATPWRSLSSDARRISESLVDEVSDWRFLYKAHVIPKS